MRSGSMMPEFSSTIFFCRCEEWNIGWANQARHRRPFETIENRGAIRGLDLLVQHARTGRNQRALGAQTHASHTFYLAMILGSTACYFLIERILYRLALARQASGSNAYIHPLGELALRLAFGFSNLVEFLRRHACVHFFRCSRMAGGATLPATSWS